MWSLLTARISLPALGAAAALGVGMWLGWSLQAVRTERAQTETRTLVAEYQRRLDAGQAAAQKVMSEARAQAKEAEHGYHIAVANLETEYAARPPTVIRVRVPGTCPVSSAGAGAPGDPGGAAGPAADRSGVGPDASDSYLSLDGRGLDALTLEAKRVSERLTALQAACR